MAFGLSNKRFSPIGVDFGADSVKLLQIVATDPPQLVAAGAMVLPESARRDTAARFTFLEDALKQLTRNATFKTRKVICSIPACQMLIHQLEIPRCEEDEVEQHVAQALRERLEVEPSRMVVRHYPVQQVMREGTMRQEVLCMAIPRETVMRYIETAQRARLDVIGMHAEPLTISKAFSHLYRRETDKARTTCFIDMGGATTKVVIAHGQTMVFAKAIHAAGDHLTRARARGEGVSFDEARTLRLRERSGETTPVPVAAEDDANGISTVTATHVILAPESETIECIIDELQLSVRHHQSLFPQRPIEKLVFLGGESHDVRICQRIAKALRIGAQLGDPLAHLVRINQSGATPGVDMRLPQPGWAVPLGLCLSEANL